MPVYTCCSCSEDGRSISSSSPHHKAFLSAQERAGEWITIGLINNMPDAAFRATERQFFSLLEAASRDDIKVLLVFYRLPEIPRKDLRAHDARKYQSVETLEDTRLDGLIVTGREPMMGKRQHTFDHLVLPGCARRCSVHGWHLPPQEREKAFRRHAV